MRLLRVLVPLVIAVGVLLAAWLSFRTRSEQLSVRAERAALKREFVERALPARALAVERPREAGEEARTLFRWYFDELQAMRNRHPGAAPEPSLVALLAQRPKATPSDRQTLEEFYRFAEERFGAMRAGRYDPLRVAGGGGLRLDLLGVEPGNHPAGPGRGLRIDFALWGVPRRSEREAQPGGRGGVERAALVASFRRLTLHLVGGDGKPYGEMSSSGEPYLKLADPERLLEDFPPGILFGTWWVEPFPREAARVKLALEVQVPGSAAVSSDACFSCDVPVAEEWKLAPGVPFQAQTRVDPSLPPARDKR